MGYLAGSASKWAMLATTALALGTSGAALAAENDDEGVGVIIVTAQKREQNVQDVPIAVTALGGETLQANRITKVTDLTGLAPGLTVSESAGGQKIPFFIMRGANSAGLVPGSDKQVSLYLDGVYLGSTRGSIFDLPDVQRIEVLRGRKAPSSGATRQRARSASIPAIRRAKRAEGSKAPSAITASTASSPAWTCHRWGHSAATSAMCVATSAATSAMSAPANFGTGAIR